MGATQTKMVQSAIEPSLSSPPSTTVSSNTTTNDRHDKPDEKLSENNSESSSSKVKRERKSKQQRDEEEQAKRAELSGMPLIHYVCRKRQKAYDKCYNNWYHKEFLPGKSMNQEEFCGDLFDLYKRCIVRGIKKEIWEGQFNLPRPHPNSPLLEYEDDDD